MPISVPRLAPLGTLIALWGALLGCALAPAHSEADFRVGLASYSAAPMQAIYGSVVRGTVGWAQVAPAHLPAGFRPADPGDPHYNWSAVDAAVGMAAQHHLRMILTFADAPSWAQGPGPVKPYVSPGGWDPNPRMFAAFVHAAAVRYGGGYPDPARPGGTLPRVKYWEAWNEPNIPGYFSAPHPVSAYRTLLNGAYGVLKSVHRDNVVALGGLAPVSPVPGSTPPLYFAAQLLCLRPVGAAFRPNRSCRRASFDAVDMHPYSLAATPTKHAYKPGDVLVGDIAKFGALVHAAHCRQIWATEFSWITNPPNSYLGDSPRTAARYVAYSMYEMWKAGITLVMWERVEDGVGGNPRDTSVMLGSGLYSSSGQPKPTLQAFAFPFVAGVGGGRGFGWGRVPTPRRATVVIQRSARGGWQTVARRRTASDGTFYARFPARGNGLYRARVQGGLTSLAYNSRPIPPIRLHAF